MARLLLIEADKLLADNTIRALARAGHDVEWHVSPQAAMESADKKQPDLIILDLLLAGHGGLEFLFELRSYPEWQALPAILSTNVSHEELAETAQGLDQLNVAAFHHKPTDSLADLLGAVEKALSKQPARA